MPFNAVGIVVPMYPPNGNAGVEQGTQLQPKRKLKIHVTQQHHRSRLVFLCRTKQRPPITMRVTIKKDSVTHN
jgi:hypothetical protein